MSVQATVVQPVSQENAERTVQFLAGWVTDGEAGAREYLASHTGDDGASLIAVRGDRVLGFTAILWESNYAGFRDQGIPLVHQISVAGPFRRHGVATLLMDAVEELARGRGIATLGITVGLFDSCVPPSGCARGAVTRLTAAEPAAASSRSARERA